MPLILIIILGQCVFAAAVVLFLRKLLDKELIKAALEKFETCKTCCDIKEITVLSASGIKPEFQILLESIRKRKFAQAQFVFKQNAEIKGGIVISIGEVLLDFSLSSRLRDFWS